MSKSFVRIALTLAGAAVLGTGAAGKANPMVGVAAMYPARTMVENAANSKDHPAPVVAVKAAGLVETLSSPGPFTVFAPTNAAFAKLPAGTVETLAKAENKATLASVLTSHVLPGRVTAAEIAAAVKGGRGKATYITADGGVLTFRKRGNGWQGQDAKGNYANITGDVIQSNGVVHVLDTALLP